MKIVRSRPREQFVIVPNASVRDRRLSYRARGVLAELLSRPDGWTVTADDLARGAKRARGDAGEGRTAIRAAFMELEAAGYLRRLRVRDGRGRISMRLELRDTADPLPSDHRQPDGRSPVGWSSSQKTGTETGTKISPPQLSPERTAVPEIGEEAAHPVEEVPARGRSELGVDPQCPVESERQEQPAVDPIPQTTPLRVPASPEVARTSAAEQVAAVWAAARVSSRPSPSGRVRVRSGAVELLSAGWTSADVTAVAVDMARLDPTWTDLARHADHWAAQQPAGAVWGSAAPAAALPGPGEGGGPAAPEPRPWCGHPDCSELDRMRSVWDPDGHERVRPCPECGSPAVVMEPAF